MKTKHFDVKLILRYEYVQKENDQKSLEKVVTIAYRYYPDATCQLFTKLEDRRIVEAKFEYGESFLLSTLNIAHAQNKLFDIIKNSNRIMISNGIVGYDKDFDFVKKLVKDKFKDKVTEC